MISVRTRKESMTHQGKQFERHFERLHLRCMKIDEVVQRSGHLSTLSSSLAASVQGSSRQGRREVNAELAGSEVEQMKSTRNTSSDECASAQISSRATTNIMGQREDHVIDERTGASTAANLACAGQAAISEDEQVPAHATSNYRLAFIFLLLLVV